MLNYAGGSAQHDVTLSACGSGCCGVTSWSTINAADSSPQGMYPYARAHILTTHIPFGFRPLLFCRVEEYMPGSMILMRSWPELVDMLPCP